MILLSAILLQLHDCGQTRKLSLWVISARVQTKVSIAVSLYFKVLIRL